MTTNATSEQESDESAADHQCNSEADNKSRETGHTTGNWTPTEGVEFLLGVSVFAYEDGHLDVVSWGEHGGIGLVAWGGLRHLGDEDDRSSTERGVDAR